MVTFNCMFNILGIVSLMITIAHKTGHIRKTNVSTVTGSSNALGYAIKLTAKEFG